MFTVKQYNSVSEREDQTTAFWKAKKIFERSVDERSEENRYSFLDGPPFVTGIPHYASLLPRIAKDLIPRYQTMKGKKVRRVWGWDCHGLPIEEIVERKLGLKNRRDIETFGVNRFIEECEKYVNEVSSQWGWYTDKIASWCDMDHAYRTMDKDYMESVIWTFKTLYDQGLIYEGTKTLLYCTRCGTPVSKFEIAMDDSYMDMEDPTIIVEFPITTKGTFEGSRILAWTTTPWTMPSNRALVVSPKDTYVEFTGEEKGKKYIVAKSRLEYVLEGKDAKVLREFLGSELLGLSYEPPYLFIPGNENDFKVYEYKGMVTMDEGTGIVHSAPGFGEIDTEMGQHYGLTLMLNIDDEGKHVAAIADFAGMYYKKSDPVIIEDLEKNDKLFSHGKIVHRFPFCYRCKTPLIQRAVKSWFIKVQDAKPDLVEKNHAINWVPEHFKEGRFRNTIETAPDWCISRTRYWATAMLVWTCTDCGEREVFGSIKELEDRSGEKVMGLHRNNVDHLTFGCQKCKGTMKRIPEVLDCWMESGSMPVGQLHYPFENKELFQSTFPADYIIEYTGQLRAWFYYMHVIGNALFDQVSFKNVVVTGVLAGNDGRKMSKSYGNYPDPKETLEKYGGDALRLYMMGSPLLQGEDANFNEKELSSQVLTVLNPAWNSLKYFSIYANEANWKPSSYLEEPKVTHLLDRWVLARLHELQSQLQSGLDAYKIADAVRTIAPFLDDVSTWYIRRSRDRFVAKDPDAIATLYYVLTQFALIVAPVVPFLAEELYEVLVKSQFSDAPESVHLAEYPAEKKVTPEQATILADMGQLRNLVSLALAIRVKEELKIRQPLASVAVKYTDGNELGSEYLDLLKDELNVKTVTTAKELPTGENWKTNESSLASVVLDVQLTKELLAEGLLRSITRQVQDERKKIGLNIGEQVNLVLWTSDAELQGQLQNVADALAKATSVCNVEVRSDKPEEQSTKEKLVIEAKA